MQTKPAALWLELSATWGLRVRVTGQSGRMSSCGVRVMKVFGTVVSTLMVVVAGVGSKSGSSAHSSVGQTTAASVASTARTRNVYGVAAVSARPEKGCPLTQACQAVGGVAVL